MALYPRKAKYMALYPRDEKIRKNKLVKYKIKLKDRNGEIEIVEQGFGIESFKVLFTGITYDEFSDLIAQLKIIDMNYNPKQKKFFGKQF